MKYFILFLLVTTLAISGTWSIYPIIQLLSIILLILIAFLIQFTNLGKIFT